MGGAIHTGGNVAQYNHRITGEWNFYWDPFAAKKVVESGIDCALFSLDSTNKCPVDREFFEQMASRMNYDYANLCS